jgi:citrate lyase beta subunit
MLEPSFYTHLDDTLAGDDSERERYYPGPAAERQPVHTVYVPADRFAEHTVAEWRAGALATLDQHGPLPGVDAELEHRVREKLAAEPIEDLRIDFEDGYGVRGDGEEDAAARAAGTALGRSAERPEFVGIRMKSFEAATRRRGLRTLELFLEAVLAFGSLPRGFRVTLPKVTSVRQIEAMVEMCAALESAFTLPVLRFEIQIETPQAILGADGTAVVATMLHTAGARCAGLHYGTYDYSASLGIAAAYQSMEHPAADHAKAVMQLAAAGTGVPVSDGSTNVLPVGDTDQVRAAWQLQLRLVRRSLERGFYQGWDLHPAQLPSRFAATFAFYRDGSAAAVVRLRAYLSRQSSGVLDEPATARALAGYLMRGVDAGALDRDEIAAQVGVGADELLKLAGRA